MVYIAATSNRERLGMNDQEVRRERVGCWEYPLIAAYTPELA